jgi:hypothetical protein
MAAFAKSWLRIRQAGTRARHFCPDNCPGGRRRRGRSLTLVHGFLRGAFSNKKRVPATPSAGLGLMQLVETLTLSRTKTQVNPPAAVPDIAKAHA